jgi:hypothetical protein
MGSGLTRLERPNDARVILASSVLFVVLSRKKRKAIGGNKLSPYKRIIRAKLLGGWSYSSSCILARLAWR